MRRRTLLQLVLLDLASSLSPARAAGPGLLHLGHAPAPQTSTQQADLRAESACWVPVGLAPLKQWIEVVAGEVLLVLRGMGFDARGASARVAGDGTGPLPWVSLRDVARVAATCLEHPEWNSTLRGVAETLSTNGVIQFLETVGAKAFTTQPVPLSVLEAPSPPPGSGTRVAPAVQRRAGS